MVNSIKEFVFNKKQLRSILILSGLLCIPVIALGNYSLIALPVVLLVILSFFYGEKFVISIILISLFTLIAELLHSYRLIIHLIDFTLLGLIFLRRYGLKFELYAQVPKSVLYLILFYFSAMIITGMVSVYPFASIPTIARQLAFFIIVYVFYSFIDDEKDIRLYFNTMIIVSCIVITVSVAEFISSGYDILSIISQNRSRVSSITGNIEAATNFTVVTFPVVLVSVLLNKDGRIKILNYLLLSYFVLGLTIAMSRSALIGIFVSSLIIFYILKRRLFYKFLISIVIIIGLFLTIQPLSDTAYFLFRIEEGMSARDFIWKMSLDMIKDNPVFGIGPGAYGYYMFNYYPLMLNDWYSGLLIYLYDVSGGQNISHSLFLVLSSDMGVFGFIISFALPIIFIKIGSSTIKKYKYYSDETYYLNVALFAAGISIIVRNIFNSIGIIYVSGIQTDLPFWLIFGSLVYFYQAPLSSRLPEKISKSKI